MTFYGQSYGTFLGAVYAELFPEKVGRLVLDGALDPALGWTEITRVSTQSAEVGLRAFAEYCLAASGCPLHGDPSSALEQIARFVNSLDAAPLAVGDSQLTQDDATAAILNELYTPISGWPDLKTALAAALDGDGSQLLDLNGGISDGAGASFLAVNCLDHGQLTPDQIVASVPALRAISPVFAASLAYERMPCAYWPAPPTFQPHAIHAVGAAPILVVGTTRDPVTPYAWSQSLANELDSGHLLTYDGDGHTAYHTGSSCVDDAIDAYFVDGTVPPDRTVC